MTTTFINSTGITFPDLTVQTTAATGGGGSSFPSGTIMLFQQTAAPTGWTKSTSDNNKAIRVVSGSVGSGGSVPFTTAFGSQTPAGSVSLSLSSGATTLSIGQIPSHRHDTTIRQYGGFGGSYYTAQLMDNYNNTIYTDYTGGGESHSHSISGTATFTGSAFSLAVQYIDVIIASKD